MILTDAHHVLKAYSEGYVGWREACRKLQIETFPELDTLLKAHHITCYQPSSEDFYNRMAQLDDLLYTTIEK